MIEYPIPPSLDARPKDRRGLPVSYVTGWVDGVPDFTAVDHNATLDVAARRLCGLCGTPLDYWIAFLGGPGCYETRGFTDPPMHPDCALAAVSLCPHIAIRATKRSKHSEARNVTPVGFVDRKPDRWGLFTTRGYRLIFDRAGIPIFKSSPINRVQWFTYDDEGRLQIEAAA